MSEFLRRSSRINNNKETQFQFEYNFIKNLQYNYQSKNISIKDIEKYKTFSERSHFLSNLIIGDLSENVEKINEIFKNIKKFGERPGLLKCEIPNFEKMIIKYGEECEENEYDCVYLHEIVVGTILNKLKIYVPNFITTFGFFQAKIDSDYNFKPSDKLEDNFFIVMEKIKGLNLSDFIVNATVSQYFQILLQIINALSVANQFYQFSHNDLHDDNIIIEILKEPILIPLYIGENKKYIYTRYLAKIVDFGQSFINIGQPLGFYGNEIHRIYSNRQNPISDAYKLICYSGYTAHISENEKLFDFISILYKDIFNEKVETKRKNNSDNNFTLKDRINHFIVYNNLKDGISQNISTDGMNYGEYFGKFENKKIKFTDNSYNIDENYSHSDLLLLLSNYFEEFDFIKN